MDKIVGIKERIERIHTILIKFRGITSALVGEYLTLKQKICDNLKIDGTTFDRYIDLLPKFVEFLEDVRKGPGSFDMKLDSNFIDGLNNEVEIPIFNIIGTGVTIFDIISANKLKEASEAIIQGKNDAAKDYNKLFNVMAPVSMVAMTTITAGLAFFIGPFALLVGAGTQAFALAPTTIASTNNILIEELDYLKSSIEFLENFTVNSINRDESDLILSYDEQILPSEIQLSYFRKNYKNIYGNQQEIIIGAMHDVIGLANSSIDNLSSRIVYNIEETLNILKEKVNIILSR